MVFWSRAVFHIYVCIDAKLDALAERHFELAVDYWENYSDVSNLVASIPEVGYQLMQWRSSFVCTTPAPLLARSNCISVVTVL